MTRREGTKELFKVFCGAAQPFKASGCDAENGYRLVVLIENFAHFTLSLF
jgi:hypothetical protein